MSTIRSRSISFRAPQNILEAIDARAAELGYPSRNAYLLGLVRYDLLTQRPHHMTCQVSHVSPGKQDKFDDWVCEQYEKREALNGSRFEHLVEAAVERAKAQGLTKKDVAKEILRIIEE